MENFGNFGIWYCLNNSDTQICLVLASANQTDLLFESDHGFVKLDPEGNPYVVRRLIINQIVWYSNEYGRPSDDFVNISVLEEVDLTGCEWDTVERSDDAECFGDMTLCRWRSVI